MLEQDRIKINFMARGKWEEVKTGLKQFCSSATSITIRFHEEQDEFILERVSYEGFVPKRIRLEYDPLVPRIKYCCCDPQEHRGEITFKLVNGSAIYLVDSRVVLLKDIVFVLSSCVTGDV
ncbi:hypothetical protein SBA6_50020 [Candidatus Sulfopaludibacter sp. SbA6]|nr:hypothetical protein SBA6_50020 [Candidatus Sulfopaludibacter sp. SbA6]